MLKPPVVLVFLGFFGFLYLLTATWLPILAAGLTMPFHEACLQLLPSSQYQEIYSALVCGTSVNQDEALRTALTKTGLLHMLVVSGSHLILLEKLLLRCLNKIENSHRVIFPLLILFALANKLEPPVFRALAALLLHHCNDSYRWSWNSIQVLSSSGLLTLLLCETEQQYFSLLLSWLASLSLIASSEFYPEKWRNGFLKSSLPHLTVYFLIAPALLKLSLPHPTSILTNWIFSPILGIALFPMAILACAIPILVPLTDQIWITLYNWISSTAHFTPETYQKEKIATPLLWLYLFCLSLLLWNSKRKRHSQ